MIRSGLMLVFVAALSLTTTGSLSAQETPSKSPQPSSESPEKGTDSKVPTEGEAGESTADREQRLADYLSGIKFVGTFTVDGKEDKLPKAEEYTISKCEKMSAENMYKMTARIKYGEIDLEVPLQIEILWSGRTPVITLDGFGIPGMGTFDARVLIHSGRYAGTWQHDAVGGHMFGKLVKE